MTLTTTGSLKLEIRIGDFLDGGNILIINCKIMSCWLIRAHWFWISHLGYLDHWGRKGHLLNEINPKLLDLSTISIVLKWSVRFSFIEQAVPYSKNPSLLKYCTIPNGVCRHLSVWSVKPHVHSHLCWDKLRPVTDVGKYKYLMDHVRMD